MGKRIGFTIIGLWCALVLIAMPLMVRADDTLVTTVQPLVVNGGPVLITEVQTGSTASGAEEFIELYNATNNTVDLSAGSWQLQIGNATATTWQSPYRAVALTGSLAPGGYYLIASKSAADSQTVQYLASTANIWFSAGISAEGAHLRLVYSVNQNQSGVCSPALAVADELEWSAVNTAGQPVHLSIDNRKPFLTSANGLAPGSTLQRVRTTNSAYLDTNNDQDDFLVAPPNAGTQNTVIKDGLPPTIGQLQQSDCQPSVTLPYSPEPAAGSSQPSVTPDMPSNSGLLAPQISELLPNPAAPQTDAADEFIELYNPNTTSFDLSGFTLESGLTFSHSYHFASGTQLPALSFMAFYAKDTKLVFANSGGQARLMDAQNNVVDQTGPYAVAAAGQSWVLSDNVWQWTIVPTPGLINVVSAPVIATKPALAPHTTLPKPAKKASSTKKPAKVKSAATTRLAKVDTKPKVTAAYAPDNPKDSPLHPGVLVAAAVLALLYGAYEYRHDMANHIRKFRDNRAARRADR